MRLFGRLWLWSAGLLMLAGCSTLPPPEERMAVANRLALIAGWKRIDLPTGAFVLSSFVPETFRPADILTIYIEGDGLAWLSSADISPDPTPLHPIGLQLALQHPAGNAAYLARPCQFRDKTEPSTCSPRWWTMRRFAPEVVEASSSAIDQLKKRFDATSLVLVGYSGGGAIATLVAAHRHDVVQLVTVAGNLNPVLWATRHAISPLQGSLNPLDVAQSLANIRQIHFVGSQDTIVEREVTDSFVAAIPHEQYPELRVVADFGHICCWADHWPELYRPFAEPTVVHKTTMN